VHGIIVHFKKTEIDKNVDNVGKKNEIQPMVGTGGIH
jgi:hypothetical protein